MKMNLSARLPFPNGEGRNGRPEDGRETERDAKRRAPVMKVKLSAMLPFLNEEDRSALLRQVLASEERRFRDVDLAALLPFLEEGEVDELFFRELEQGNDIGVYCPFVSEEAYGRLIDRILEGSIEAELDGIYPFLPDRELHRLLKAVLRKKDE